MTRSQGTVQVGEHGWEHSGQQLASLRQAQPANLCQLSIIADEDIRPADWLRGQVNHGPSGVRVHPPAQHPARRYLQAGLFLDLANGGVPGRLAGMDLTRYERPGPGWRPG